MTLVSPIDSASDNARQPAQKNLECTKTHRNADSRVDTEVQEKRHATPRQAASDGTNDSAPVADQSALSGLAVCTGKTVAKRDARLDRRTGATRIGDPAMPKPALPRHQRNRDGNTVKPVQMRLEETLHKRVADVASKTKRTVPALITLFVEEGLERMNVDGLGAVSP
jgi:hypothetical protein